MFPGVLPIAVAQEKAAKAEELLKEINLLFKKLKVIYKNLQPIPNVNDDQGGLLLDIDMTEVSWYNTIQALISIYNYSIYKIIERRLDDVYLLV